jgi:hypothetical protein
MVAGLVGHDTTVHGPGAAPVVLVVVLLVATPAHPHGAEHELAEAAGVQGLAGLDDGHVEAVLFDHQQMPVRFSCGGDHAVGVCKRQRHRLFDDGVPAGSENAHHMVGVHAARRQHRHGIEISTGQHRFERVERRNVMLLRECRGALGLDVAHGRQASIVDLPFAEQFPMSHRNAAAAKQPDADALLALNGVQ